MNSLEYIDFVFLCGSHQCRRQKIGDELDLGRPNTGHDGRYGHHEPFPVQKGKSPHSSQSQPPSRTHLILSNLYPSIISEYGCVFLFLYLHLIIPPQSSVPLQPVPHKETLPLWLWLLTSSPPAPRNPDMCGIPASSSSCAHLIFSSFLFFLY